MTVFTGTIGKSLKKTLEDINTDPTDEKGSMYKDWLQVKGMDDNYEDDLEVGGPGLASEVSEGAEIPLGTIAEGYLTRYTARKFGLRLIVTEEAAADGKYSKVIDAAGRLRRSIWKTVDIDTTAMLQRGFNTSYTGGDGLCLWNSAHTLPGGGTFSNTFATAMSPSRTAVIIGRTQAGKFPGHDGVTEGNKLTKVICPLDQWGVWEGILGSEKAPENDTNEINVVRGLNLSLCANQYWDNTTTNWAFLTDCDSKLNIRWRRRPRARAWVENSQELMQHSNTARWSRGWSDPRCTLGSEA
jgi:hypothetical protein